MCLEFQTIIPKSVFNGILIGKVFQIKVSDGLVHSLRTRQKVNLHTARVFMGARVFRSLYVFRVPNHHFKECVQWHLYRRSISNRGFIWSCPPLGTHQKVNLHPARVFTGARCFRSLYVFRVPNHHSKECVQWHLNRKSISNRGFRWSSPFPWNSSKSKLSSC